MRSFEAARRRGIVSDLYALARGRPVDLLPFEEVRKRLNLSRVVDRGIAEVPLAAIVGSVGRGPEFNRAFLPREGASRERWEDVQGLVDEKGFPPVELYAAGGVYFVLDGHHRVSVARAEGAESIEAHVREFATPVALSGDESLEEVVLKAARASFLEITGLVPDAGAPLEATEALSYERLLDHIAVHGYFRGLETGQDVCGPDAAASWLTRVYRPTVALIRESGLLEDFPGRTETDLYLAVMEHLHYLMERTAGRVSPARVVRHFMLRGRADRRSRNRLAQLFWKLRDR